MQFTGKSTLKASDFDVIYTPEKSGSYEIRVFCGNIPLNNDHPFIKQVIPGNMFNETCSIECICK